MSKNAKQTNWDNAQVEVRPKKNPFNIPPYANGEVEEFKGGQLKLVLVHEGTHGFGRHFYNMTSEQAGRYLKVIGYKA